MSRAAAATTTNSAIRAHITDYITGVSAGVRWCPVPVDDASPSGGRAGSRRYLLYGPRLGRLYLLPEERAFDASLHSFLGLSATGMTARLDDPVQRIAYDESGLQQYPRADINLAIGTAYRVVHWSRYWLPLHAAAALARRAASFRRWVPPSGTPDDLLNIARQLRDVEFRLGVADCYPRALLTAYLCLLAGRDCILTIGVLTPTRKMHVWCSAEGVLPYEPLPEHYLYRPLWSKTLLS